MRLCWLLILADPLLIGRALLRCLGQFRLVHLCWRQASLRLFPAGCFLLLLGGPLLWDRLARLGPFFFFLLGCFGLLFMC
jgi:hypothetical protein